MTARVTEQNIHIGTSGWHYAHWCGPFYPEKFPSSKMLRWYIERFDTVEINNCFYRLPTEEAVASWRDQTPPGFRFAVKASRYLTHRKRLREPENAIDNFLPRMEVLGPKLGPVLFQLPPRWNANPERLEQLLKILPRTHRYAFEFRDPSWHQLPVYEVLRRYNAAFCIYELAGFQSPIEITADFIYIRLHGPGEKAYQGSYTGSQLGQWARRANSWSKSLEAIYFYFDNDQAGFAASNALELKRQIYGPSNRTAAA
ncbi:MAG TPA: DUF72 domain-containing protein [Terriglobales bacterium]|nr:DUF72 domain-containing protein [Terriglobales bacterium]